MSEASVAVEPMDAHNRALVGHVHPSDWTNPMPSGRYNLVVIGAGPAGLVTAASAVGVGAKVALIERRLMGGDCLNSGCVPSKSLIKSARIAHQTRIASSFGVTVNDGVAVDFPAVMERVRRIRASISGHDSAKRFQDELHVDVYLGDGRFTGPDAVDVAGQTLRFSKAVIATGARAAIPSVPGLTEVGFFTNETVFTLTDLPPRLAVLGGGPIGCELAQAFQRLGSAVYLLQRGRQILNREDADVAEILRTVFATDGIQLRENCEIVSVDMVSTGKAIRFRAGASEEEIEVDEILVGVGRTPNVEGLGLETAGVEYDAREGVKVDDHLRSTNPRIFAVGDCCMTHKFTHAADAAARIVIQNALFWGRKKLSSLVIPWCTYTDPEVAHVGLSENDATERQIAVSIFKRDLKSMDRGATDGIKEGFVKILVAKGSDKILGATIVAAHAGDMLNSITLAMTHNVGLRDLSAVIHPYPTLGEAVKQAADAYNRTRLTPALKRLSTWIMAKRR